jgi:hypothetical protein
LRVRREWGVVDDVPLLLGYGLLGAIKIELPDRNKKEAVVY